MTVFEKVAKVVADQVGIDIEDISEESDLEDDLGCDSFDVVEIIMKLEDDLGKEIPDDEFIKINTIGDIVKFFTGGTD
ncbi:MAG TPA: acyl carrier protein [Negativicutes bacterium]|nr:acyl carrier protein [Negativicutes bacterium]